MKRIAGLESVAETMVIPLCYRAVEARQPEPFVQDTRAQEIIDALGVDPAHLKWRFEQQLFAMLRARQFDRWAGDYLAQKPESTVVEIGCGLDARFERMDNGRVQWIDMDLPEVIALRRRFFNDTARRRMLSHSVFDLDWLDCIPAGGDHLFLAEGVFAYFSEAEVRRVCLALAEHFPGSEMVIDAPAPFMVQMSAVLPSFRGYDERPRWGVSTPGEVEAWGHGIRVLDWYGYFDEPEPRLASLRWMTWFPILRNLAHVMRLQLGAGI